MLPLLIDFLGVGSSKCLPQVSISGSKDMKTNVESFEGTDKTRITVQEAYFLKLMLSPSVQNIILAAEVERLR